MLTSDLDEFVHYQILSKCYKKKYMETSKENLYVDIRASRVNTSSNFPNRFDKELCMETCKENFLCQHQG